MRIDIVDVDAINVDETYQRDCDKRRVARVVKAYQAGAAKAVSLSRRADGSLWVYDGRHTLEVYRALDIKRVPAVIVDGDQEREARWFLLMNGRGSARVTQRDMQKAGIVANEESALLAQTMIQRYGLSIAKGGVSPRATSAVGFLRDCCQADLGRLERAMEMLDRLWQDEPETWTRTIMRGAWEIAGMSRAREIEHGLHEHRVTPRRVLDVAQGMQMATGEPGGGMGYVKKAMLKLARVDA